MQKMQHDAVVRRRCIVQTHHTSSTNPCGELYNSPRELLGLPSFAWRLRNGCSDPEDGLVVVRWTADILVAV